MVVESGPNQAADHARGSILVAEHPELGTYHLYVEEKPSCCSVRTRPMLRACMEIATQGYYKDAFHEYLVQGNRSAVNPLLRGSKACAHLTARVDGCGGAVRPSACASLGVRIRRPLPASIKSQATRKRQCDDFYAGFNPAWITKTLAWCNGRPSPE
jgi:hypothetical protein